MLDDILDIGGTILYWIVVCLVVLIVLPLSIILAPFMLLLIIPAVFIMVILYVIIGFALFILGIIWFIGAYILELITNRYYDKYKILKVFE